MAIFYILARKSNSRISFKELLQISLRVESIRVEKTKFLKIKIFFGYTNSKWQANKNAKETFPFLSF